MCQWNECVILFLVSLITLKFSDYLKTKKQFISCNIIIAMNYLFVLITFWWYNLLVYLLFVFSFFFFFGYLIWKEIKYVYQEVIRIDWIKVKCVYKIELILLVNFYLGLYTNFFFFSLTSSLNCHKYIKYWNIKETSNHTCLFFIYKPIFFNKKEKKVCLKKRDFFFFFVTVVTKLVFLIKNF